MPVPGSDCLTGKKQYVSRQAANADAKAARKRGWATYCYRCAWCACYHIGNRRGSDPRRRRA
jgi:hypothetical protein